MTDRKLLQKIIRIITLLRTHGREQAIDKLEMIAALEAALAQGEQDWDLLAATQASLREHMSRIKELEAQLAQSDNQKPKLTDAGADTNIPLWGLEPKGSGMVTLHQREWVGLTDEDAANICMQSDVNNWRDEQVINAVEAKLKEKNNAV